MHHHPRGCRILKWLGTLVCVLLLLGYLPAVLRRVVSVRSGRTDLWINARLFGGGLAALVFVSPGTTRADVRTTYEIRRVDPPFVWAPRWNSRVVAEGPPGTREYSFLLPLWIPLLLLAIPTVYWWRRGSLMPPGHCRKCGYNLSGNVSGRCPECGAVVETAFRP